MEKELISCIITTYHREFEYIERALKSVLNQSYENIEVLVVDDNEDNSDYCKSIINGLKNYPSVKYYKQNGNKGACAARNLGIENSNGKFVAFLDDDDEWLPEKLSVQKDAFDNAPENTGLVFCHGYVVYDDDPSKNETYAPTNEIKYPTHSDLLYADYIGSTSHPLILKEAIVSVGMFDIRMPARQDYEMWIRISQKYKTCGVFEPLFLYHQHSGEQITSSSKKRADGYILLYNKYKAEYIADPKLFYSIMDRILVATADYKKSLWYYYRLRLKIYSIFKR